MEKRQLVRTFGSALAAATLSFGLFAAPALAVDKYDVKGEAVVFVGDEKDGKAVAGDIVRIEIPVSVATLDKVQAGTMTFKNSDGTFDQELTLFFEPTVMPPTAEEMKIGNVPMDKFAFYYENDDNGQLAITKINARARVADQMLNGTWTLDEIKLYSDAEMKDEIASVSADLSFEVKDNDDPAPLSADLESLITKKQVYRGKSNQLTAIVPGATLDSPAKATYVNPAGEEQEIDSKVKNSMGEVTFRDLNTQVEGLYDLKELKVGRNETMTWSDDTGAIKNVANGLLTTSVTYDDSDLSDGDYVVTKTGVEAMMRLYNPYDGQHLYTNDPVEATAAAVAGWDFEGLAWYAPVEGLYRDAIAPVYRVYNQYNGEHHYTTSSAEVLSLVAAGWTDEGVGFYTTTKGAADAQAVYRLFNPFATVGTHHYTLGAEERDALVEAGWVDEGIGWYGVKVDLDV